MNKAASPYKVVTLLSHTTALLGDTYIVLLCTILNTKYSSYCILQLLYDSVTLMTGALVYSASPAPPSPRPRLLFCLLPIAGGQLVHGERTPRAEFVWFPCWHDFVVPS